MKRIAFVFHDAEVYGAPKSLLDLVDGLQRLDDSFKCFAVLPYKGPLLHEIEKRRLPYQVISYPRWVHKANRKDTMSFQMLIARLKDNKFTRAAKSLVASYKIVKFLKKWEADMVYTNTSVVAVGAVAALASNRKHVWHVREFHEALKLDWGNRFFAYLLNKSKAAIFTSHTLQQYYSSLNHADNHRVIYNGVVAREAFDRIKITRENCQTSQQKRPFTFCMVGLITPEKGQPEAVKALARLQQQGLNARLLIAGKGGIDKLRELVAKHQLESSVDIVGHVTDPFRDVYFQADAYLMCSVHESFGRVTVEAMAAALPVIGKVSRYAGTSELIQDGITGLLYDGDEQALAEKMKLLILHPEKRMQLGEQAWQYARENFNKELYVDKVYNLLKTL